MTAARSPVPPPTVLVRADSRDIPILGRLAARGYRLGGFPMEAVEALRAQGLPVGLLDLAPRRTPEQLARRRTQLESSVRRWLGALDGVRLKSALPAVSAAELRAIQKALEEHVRGSFVAAAELIDTFDSVAGPENLRLLLLRDDAHALERSMALAARLRRIPSVHVLHGVPSAPMVASEVHADVAAVYGPSTRDWYETFGTPPERIAITGNPVWEHHISPQSHGTREDLHTKLALDSTRPTVLFATTWVSRTSAYDLIDPEWPWRYFEATVKAVAEVRRRHDVQLVVKLHPGATSKDIIAQHRSLVEAHNIPSAIAVGHAEPWQLAQSDCVVCTESNIGIEAMLTGTPVVNLRLEFPPRDPAALLFRDDDAAITVTRQSTIARTIESVLFDQDTKEQLRQARPLSTYRFNYLADGLATARIEQVVLRLLDPAAAVRDFEAGAPAPLTASPTEAELVNITFQHLQHAERLDELGDDLGAAYVRERGMAIASGATS